MLIDKLLGGFLLILSAVAIIALLIRLTIKECSESDAWIVAIAILGGFVGTELLRTVWAPYGYFLVVIGALSGCSLLLHALCDTAADEYRAGLAGLSAGGLLSGYFLVTHAT